MSVCEKCLVKDGCKFADSFEDGKLPLAHCKTFIGDEPKKTNFERITYSDYALARGLQEWYNKGVEDSKNKKHPSVNMSKLINWLNRESE